jgi:NAD(P)-dependent dehydrogenase (short-subunit alcohol dehydrogenase family)
MPEGRVIVTGGTGGLGAGVVERLLAAGHRLTVTWVVEEERERAEVAHRDAPVELRRLDVLDEDAFAALAAEVDSRDGLGGLVHLVGGYLDGRPFGEGRLADLDGQLDLNLRSLAAGLGAVLPRLAARGGGRVVAVGARAALRPWAGASAYAASKAGVVAMVQAAQQEVIADGVCVNCILPSVIDTPANRAAEPDADHGRWVSPREIGEVVAFLMSDGASAVTGAAIPVYGRA